MSVAESVVPDAASVTAPVLSEFAITGSSAAAATVTAAPMLKVAVSEPPPLSVSDVIVTARLPAVGDWSVFLYAIPSTRVCN